MARNLESRKLVTRADMAFDVSTAGRSGSRHSHDTPVRDLGQHGHYAVAPNQRGYSPGARPDPSQCRGPPAEAIVPFTD
jgi:hypothetical protein